MSKITLPPALLVRASGGSKQEARHYFVKSYMNTVHHWVTASEVETLRKVARKARNPTRNEVAILMLDRHGLRGSNICKFQVDKLVLEQSTLFIKLSKNGINGMHPMASLSILDLSRFDAAPWYC